MNLLKRAAKDLEEYRDITDDVVEEDFVPYACHYSPHTILTKNGELMQTIKIVGYSYELITHDVGDLRSMIRAALRDSVDSTEYAVWFHTVRRRENLFPDGEYPEGFARQLNEAWRDKNDWSHKFINEVFITIVREGESAIAMDPRNLARGLLPFVDDRLRWEYLDRSAAALNKVVEKMLGHLQVFGAKRLGLVEKEGKVFSEPLKFLNKLVRLVDEEILLPREDLSKFLTKRSEVTFGFNALEVRDNKTGRRRFGAVLTLKEYKDIPLEVIDEFLQVPVEFIVSQGMDFINKDKALEVYKYQEDIFRISRCDELAELTGLTHILESDTGKVTDFGEHQINILLLADSVKELEKASVMAVGALRSLGVVAFREDVFMEDGYWALLPANFPFLKRRLPINTDWAGGFSLLSNYPAGRADGSIWGPAVTVLHTAAGTPYFFNFHVDNNGHTAVIGPRGAGKTVLMNFLVAEARKFSPRLFYFDFERASEIFIRGQKGDYYYLHPPGKTGIDADAADDDSVQITPGVGLPPLNPLQLDDTPENRSFLSVWLQILAAHERYEGMELSEEDWPFIEEGLEHIYSLPQEQRTLDALIDYLRPKNEGLGVRLGRWYRGGEYGGIFDHPHDSLSIGDITGFDVTGLIKSSHLFSAVFAYLIQRVIQEMQGEPSILVLDEAWHLLSNPVFASRLGGWLEMMRSRNAVVVMATEAVEEALESQLSPTIMEHIATQIYLPNEEPGDGYSEVFGLSEREVMFVGMMQPEQRHFLLKRGVESIVAELDLSKMEPYVAVLSATDKGYKTLREIIEIKGDDPDVWLPLFMEEVMNEEEE